MSRSICDSEAYLAHDASFYAEPVNLFLCWCPVFSFSKFECLSCSSTDFVLVIDFELTKVGKVTICMVQTRENKGKQESSCGISYKKLSNGANFSKLIIGKSTNASDVCVNCLTPALKTSLVRHSIHKAGPPNSYTLNITRKRISPVAPSFRVTPH